MDRKIDALCSFWEIREKVEGFRERAWERFRMRKVTTG